MPRSGRAPASAEQLCPDCQKPLRFVASWTFRGLWGFNEVRTYECAEHGPVFVNASPQESSPHTFQKPQINAPESGERDSLLPVPRAPKPTLNSGAIAIPEPDSSDKNHDAK